MAKLNKTGLIFLCFLFLFTCKDEPVIKYTLKLSTTGGGTASIISPAGTSATEGTYDAGTKITVKATPKKDYNFVKWSSGETTPDLTVMLNKDLTLTAEQLKTKIMEQTVQKKITISDCKQVNGVDKLYEEEKTVRFLSFSKWKK